MQETGLFDTNIGVYYFQKAPFCAFRSLAGGGGKSRSEGHRVEESGSRCAVLSVSEQLGEDVGRAQLGHLGEVEPIIKEEDLEDAVALKA